MNASSAVMPLNKVPQEWEFVAHCVSSQDKENGREQELTCRACEASKHDPFCLGFSKSGWNNKIVHEACYTAA